MHEAFSPAFFPLLSIVYLPFLYIVYRIFIRTCPLSAYNCPLSIVPYFSLCPFPAEPARPAIFVYFVPSADSPGHSPAFCSRFLPIFPIPQHLRKARLLGHMVGFRLPKPPKAYASDTHTSHSSVFDGLSPAPGVFCRFFGRPVDSPFGGPSFFTMSRACPSANLHALHFRHFSL